MATRTMDDFWPGIEEAEPAAPQPLLVAADWLEECDTDRAYHTALAYALRWCAARQRRPYKRPWAVREPWIWVRHQYYRHRTLTGARLRAAAAAVIPEPLIDEEFEAHRSCVSAYETLAERLWTLREVVIVPELVLPPVVLTKTTAACTVCGVLRDEAFVNCPVCAIGGTKVP